MSIVPFQQCTISSIVPFLMGSESETGPLPLIISSLCVCVSKFNFEVFPTRQQQVQSCWPSFSLLGAMVTSGEWERWAVNNWRSVCYTEGLPWVKFPGFLYSPVLCLGIRKWDCGKQRALIASLLHRKESHMTTNQGCEQHSPRFASDYRCPALSGLQCSLSHWLLPDVLTRWKNKREVQLLWGSCVPERSRRNDINISTAYHLLSHRIHRLEGGLLLLFFGSPWH